MREPIDRYRAQVIADLLGAAVSRDVASDAIGPLARTVVVAARLLLLGETEDEASAAEMARTDYPDDLEYVPPGRSVEDAYERFLGTT